MFELGARQKDGATLRDHLESDARQGGFESQWRLDNPPPLSPHIAHVWAWYCDLCQTRQSYGMGPSRLSRLEIQAWERDERVRLEPWERRAIMALDAEHLTVMGRDPKDQEAHATGKAVEAHLR